MSLTRITQFWPWLLPAMMGMALAQQPSGAKPPDQPQPFLQRTQADAQTQEDVTVTVAALRPEDSLAVFGLPLADQGVQPVWVRIENRGARSWRFMPIFLDRDYFSPHEVAWMFHAKDAGSAGVRALLAGRAMPRTVAPNSVTSGYVYTNQTLGFKVVNVELVGDHAHLQFDFAHEQPGGRFDFRSLDPERLHPAAQLRNLTLPELRAALQALPCCTTDKPGTHLGDPLNLAMVGSERDLLAALVRSGWDFTDALGARSTEHMVSAFVLRGRYRNAPVSSLYFEGRAQDFAMQRSRNTVSQRNHLRLWMTPLRLDGQPVWVGQISRDIGVRLTDRSPTFTTHAIDPDVDEARDYLIEDLLRSGVAQRYGFVGGVGAASADQPRRNLTGDPYYTDGRRLLVFPSRQNIPLNEVETLLWD
ncbi:LssY C-terminal domain-containing protein [Roseateles saccharophilus]|uniref:LssY-like putative type I secretion system component LssY n=1 Tax=Roseateles saccharophilus TaxID=304 RepID=A0A4R3UJ31_ROSSA|nr:LssY C-terminal domain-containing protein [Roseateles saccharophilus]MDG0834192.1 hypothetical protein [Roseateles saccharophilus]TCU89946.1 LssY-like putative type I secretion system component LssY [Roseateles saccharophilus]